MLARAVFFAGALAAAILFLLAPGSPAAPLGATAEYGLPTSEAQPTGMAPGPDGNLWFSEFGTAKIGRITPSGLISEFETPTPESGPSRITLGPDGNMWF